jgi:hypothetical protein
MHRSIFALNLLVTFAFALDFSSQKMISGTMRMISEDEAVYLKERKAAETTYLDEHKWYLGGERVRGDGIVSETQDDFEFDQVRDAYFELKFPKQNNFYFTHISAFIQQSSSLGKAYIVDGGIGKGHF